MHSPVTSSVEQFFNNRPLSRRSYCSCAILLSMGLLSTQAEAQFASPTDSFSAAATSPVEASLPSVRVSAPKSTSPRMQSKVGEISDAALEDTPQSVSITSAESIRSSGATTLSGVMRTQTSVSDAYNTIGYIESLSVRGFLLDNASNYRRDGMPISNHSPLALENKERIETLMGVSGLHAGVSSPGGLVNYVLKRPTDYALREIALGVSERGTRSVKLDIGGRSESGVFGYRINSSLETRRPLADNAPGNKKFLSGFFDLRLSKIDSLEFEFEHLRSRQVSVPGLGLLDVNGDGVGEVIPPANPKLNLNAQTWTQPFASTSTVASLRYERALANDWRIGARFLDQKIRSDDRIAFPDGCSSATTYVYPGLCGNGDVDIYDYRSENERRHMRGAEAYLRGKFTTGPIEHELQMSWRGTHYTENYEPFQAYNWVGTINAFAPSVIAGDGTKSETNTLIDARNREISVSDVLRFNSRSALWLGLRHTALDRTSVRTDGSSATQYSQAFNTLWTSVTVKPSANTMIYFSTAEGVETEVVPNRSSVFTNAGQVLPAFKSKQIELGIKTRFEGVGLFTATLFSIRKPSSDDVVLPGNTLLTKIADGRLSRHRGIETSFSGRVTSNLSLSIGLTAIDAKQLSDANGLYTGKRTTNVSPLATHIQGNWQVSQDLQWQNALHLFSGKYVTRDNSVKLPAGGQWDTGFSYTQKSAESVTIWRIGVDNVTNRYYWRDAPTQYWGGTYLFAAQPRTFRLSVSTRF